MWWEFQQVEGAGGRNASVWETGVGETWMRSSRICAGVSRHVSAASEDASLFLFHMNNAISNIQNPIVVAVTHGSSFVLVHQIHHISTCFAIRCCGDSSAEAVWGSLPARAIALSPKIIWIMDLRPVSKPTCCSICAMSFHLRRRSGHSKPVRTFLLSGESCKLCALENMAHLSRGLVPNCSEVVP